MTCHEICAIIITLNPQSIDLHYIPHESRSSAAFVIEPTDSVRPPFSLHPSGTMASSRSATAPLSARKPSQTPSRSSPRKQAFEEDVGKSPNKRARLSHTNTCDTFQALDAVLSPRVAPVESELGKAALLFIGSGQPDKLTLNSRERAATSRTSSKHK